MPGWSTSWTASSDIGKSTFCLAAGRSAQTRTSGCCAARSRRGASSGYSVQCWMAGSLIGALVTEEADASWDAMRQIPFSIKLIVPVFGRKQSSGCSSLGVRLRRVDSVTSYWCTTPSRLMSFAAGPCGRALCACGTICVGIPVASAGHMPSSRHFVIACETCLGAAAPQALQATANDRCRISA